MKDTVKELSINKGSYGSGGWKCYKCSCGREFCYTKDMEKEQADCLALRRVTELNHPVQVVRFPEEGIRVVGCSCWEEEAKQLVGVDDSSDHQQAIYDCLKDSTKETDEMVLSD